MADDTPAGASQPDPTQPAADAANDFLSPDAVAFDVPTEAAQSADGLSDQAAIDELLKQANFEDPNLLAGLADVGLTDSGPEMPSGAAPVEMPNFQQVMADVQVSSIDLLRDVDLNVKIELGRSRMLVEDVLKLGEGSVVELDKLAGDPVDVFVNDRLVARGEVLVLNDNFCVRVNEIVAGVKEQGA